MRHEAYTLWAKLMPYGVVYSASDLCPEELLLAGQLMRHGVIYEKDAYLRLTNERMSRQAFMNSVLQVEMRIRGTCSHYILLMGFVVSSSSPHEVVILTTSIQRASIPI